MAGTAEAPEGKKAAAPPERKHYLFEQHIGCAARDLRGQSG